MGTLSAFSRCENSTERLSQLSKATQHLSGRAVIRTQVSGSCSLTVHQPRLKSVKGWSQARPRSAQRKEDFVLSRAPKAGSGMTVTPHLEQKAEASWGGFPSWELVFLLLDLCLQGTFHLVVELDPKCKPGPGAVAGTQPLGPGGGSYFQAWWVCLCRQSGPGSGPTWERHPTPHFLSHTRVSRWCEPMWYVCWSLYFCG